MPKKDGTFRLILDLSSPHNGTSINDGIDRSAFSVKYSSFDDAIRLITKLGHASFMAKIDIKHAFRICPVRLLDLPLLGMYWEGSFYVDTRLPFGSRSSPYIFNKFADALAWIIITVCGIIHLCHYLDDFFLAAHDESTCKKHMHTILKLFEFLGVPVAEDKLIGPSTCLTYLGIEIDTQAHTMRLPVEKLADLNTELASWLMRSKSTKRELLSIIGKLSFAAKVVKPGRMFLRRLINLSKTSTRLHHRIVISPQVK